MDKFSFTFDQLRVFVAIVTSGTFKTASLRLYKSQSTLSKQIQKLENILNAKLIIRSTSRPLYLTFQGKIVFDYAIDILILSEKLCTDMKTAGLKSNLFIIGTNHKIYEPFLKKLINFYNVYLSFDIKIELRISTLSKLYFDLYYDRIDFIITNSPLSKNFIPSQKFYSFLIDRIVLITCLKTNIRNLNLSEICNLRLLVLPFNNPIQAQINYLLDKNNICLHDLYIIKECDSIIELKKDVKKNIGVALIPEYFLEEVDLLNSIEISFSNKMFISMNMFFNFSQNIKPLNFLFIYYLYFLRMLKF
tara:strand:- start:13188 stop:14102 length:915 start_codon:yes stop_codon:yes gene_type:complete